MPGSEDFSDLVEPLHREIAGLFAAGEQVTIEQADHFSILVDRANAQTMARLIADYVARTVSTE